MKNLITILTIPFCFFLTTSVNAQNNHETNIRSAYAALEKHDYEAFKKLCTAEYEEQNLGPATIKGVDNAVEMYKNFLDAFPDLKFNIKSIVPAGQNRYFLLIQLTGTNTGTFMGFPPTGKKVEAQDMDIVVLNDRGLCISHRATNPNALLDAIGYGFLTNPNTMTILELYGNFGKAEYSSIAAKCSDNVIWDVRDNKVFEKSQIYHGSKEILNFFKNLENRCKVTQFLPSPIWAEGDDVCVRNSVEFMYNNSVDKYRFDLFHHFKFKNGKIIAFKEVSSTPEKI
ncbi:MAG: ester cyclase [Saprospiraceae bacterium]|nr:ester cyclase [Saprospiraceae bacterium]